VRSFAPSFAEMFAATSKDAGPGATNQSLN
jgi:hypothetical protein